MFVLATYLEMALFLLGGRWWGIVTTFRSGDKEMYSRTRAELKREIRAARDRYKRKLEGHLMDNNPWQVLQGIQSITNCEGTNTHTIRADALLAEEQNCLLHALNPTDYQCPRQYTAAPHLLSNNTRWGDYYARWTEGNPLDPTFYLERHSLLVLLNSGITTVFKVKPLSQPVWKQPPSSWFPKHQVIATGPSL